MKQTDCYKTVRAVSRLFHCFWQLDLAEIQRQFIRMIAKAQILEAVKKLPETATYSEIVNRVELLATVREAQEQIQRGEGVPLENVLREISTAWVTNSVKARVLKSVGNAEDDSTFEQINERVHVLAAIQEGLDSLDRGEGVPIEEVEKMMTSWITK